MVQQDSPGSTSSGLNWISVALIVVIIAAVGYSIWRGVKMEQKLAAAIAAQAAGAERERAADARIIAAEKRIESLTSSITVERARADEIRLRQDELDRKASLGKITPYAPKGLHAQPIADRINRIRL